jgi:hypothetical protein
MSGTNILNQKDIMLGTQTLKQNLEGVEMRQGKMNINAENTITTTAQ